MENCKNCNGTCGCKDERTHLVIPSNAIYLEKGERFAGTVFFLHGKPSHHVILMPQHHNMLTWHEAMHFAARAGGVLPTRVECNLLQANAWSFIPACIHWTCDKYSINTPWCHDFSNGGAYSSTLYDRISVCVIRRIICQDDYRE